MTIDPAVIIVQLHGLPDPELVQRALLLLQSANMRCISDNPRRVKVSEILKVWRIRHKNTEITKHEIYGLPFLLSALGELPPESVLDQIGIVGGELAGIFWRRIDNGKLVGAVISSIADMDA